MNQAAFAQALLNPDLGVRLGLTDPQGRAAPKRFAVYRNNVAVGLSKALEQGFPVVQRLVGDAFFSAMAGVFVREHPPTSPLLMLYGADFPAFLRRFPPVQHLGYLPDVAQLELALRESYQAADAAGLPVEAIAGLEADVLMASRLRLAPSLRVVQSNWPIHGIWLANSKGGPPPTMEPQDVLVLRPEFDPIPFALPQGGARIINGLLSGVALGTALELSPMTDPASILGPLLQGRAILEVTR
ncbi:MAG: putative DNA-binding domain-containing protein [Rhodobacteraceae bacterium]|nr:putative DNA-binding domain-containing protein [Paracoccaceae bacterium]MCF8513669.1 putative DNA-binding domain-containing protein [Paracoccaceae bacterium]MCF8517914.1 putative DNA-binding domain-containing protein [Paracoccaceae bacterium]